MLMLIYNLRNHDRQRTGMYRIFEFARFSGISLSTVALWGSFDCQGRLLNQEFALGRDGLFAQLHLNSRAIWE